MSRSIVYLLNHDKLASLDKIDLKILKILQEDSSVTNLVISEKVGLSPAPTLARVKKLESSGILKSYHANVDPSKVGLGIRTFILIKLNWAIGDAHLSFVEHVKEITEIVRVNMITGEGDYLMELLCSSIRDYEKLFYSKLSKIKEIDDMKTFVVLSEVKNNPVLPIDYD